MKHEIDLKNYQIRTDLVIETLENKDIDTKIEEINDVKITYVNIDKNSSTIINKKIGNYITLEFKDITDNTNLKNIIDVFSIKLKYLLNLNNINENDTCIIIGLGNINSTPDALGPKVINEVLVTSHLFKLGVVEDGYRNVSAISPGVMAQTGIETSEYIKSIVDLIKPDFVIIIDALASMSIERVNKTIQMTDTGIHPGSGIGNSRKEISKEILNIPVISIGVPTVVDAVTIVSDTINYMYKNYSYIKENIDNPMNKLAVGSINYLNKDIKIDSKDKEELFGIVGNLNDEEIRNLIHEVLSPIGYNLMVTPKEVDFVLDKLVEALSKGIDLSLHKNID